MATLKKLQLTTTKYKIENNIWTIMNVFSYIEKRTNTKGSMASDHKLENHTAYNLKIFDNDHHIFVNPPKSKKSCIPYIL